MTSFQREPDQIDMMGEEELRVELRKVVVEIAELRQWCMASFGTTHPEMQHDPKPTYTELEAERDSLKGENEQNKADCKTIMDESMRLQCLVDTLKGENEQLKAELSVKDSFFDSFSKGTIATEKRLKEELSTLHSRLMVMESLVKEAHDAWQNCRFDYEFKDTLLERGLFMRFAEALKSSTPSNHYESRSAELEKENLALKERIAELESSKACNHPALTLEIGCIKKENLALAYQVEEARKVVWSWANLYLLCSKYWPVGGEFRAKDFYFDLKEQMDKATLSLPASLEKIERMRAVLEAARPLTKYLHYRHFVEEACSILCGDVQALKEAFAAWDEVKG